MSASDVRGWDSCDKTGGAENEEFYVSVAVWYGLYLVSAHQQHLKTVAGEQVFVRA